MVEGAKIAKLIFFCFLFVFAVIPLSFHYLAPLLAILGITSIVYASISLIRGVPRSAFYMKEVALSFIACGLMFLIYSIALGNSDLNFIYKDSVGFVFYLFYFPLAVMVVKGDIDRVLYKKFLLYLGLFVALLHMAGFFAFHVFLGEVNFETVDAANTLLSEWGSAAKFGGAHWLVRVDFAMSSLVIAPTLICFDNFVRNRFDSSNFILLIVFFFSIFIEGHRALALVIFIGCMLLMLRFQGVKRFTITLLTSVLVLGFVVAYFSRDDDHEGVFSRYFELTTTAGLDDARKEQFPSLLKQIELHPILGNGFGSNANVIRNEERPYMYELDLLAVVMKLGLVGAIWYFGTILCLLYSCLKISRYGGNGYIYFTSGIVFLIYSGTNGGFAMSIVSSLFYLFLMLGVTVEHNSRLDIRELPFRPS